MSRGLFYHKGWLAYYGELIGVWASRSGQIQNAEDAAQDAALAMLEGDPAAISDPRAYLRRSAHNGLIDIHRRRQARQATPLHELAETDMPADGRDPESALRANRLADALMDALSELPAKCQQVYVHHRLEGWTHAEIARNMGMSRSMVEKHMARALLHINERLHAYAPH